MAAARKADLRAVGADEKPAAKSITKAAKEGTHRELLEAMRDRIAKTVEDPKCPPRDLASLSRRLWDIAKEIEALDESGEGVDGEPVEDEAWNPAAI